MSVKPEVNLDILRELVKQLEDALDKTRVADKSDKMVDFIVEAAKAAGLASAIAQEATYLVVDIAQVAKNKQASQPAQVLSIPGLFKDPKGGVS